MEKKRVTSQLGTVLKIDSVGAKVVNRLPPSNLHKVLLVPDELFFSLRSSHKSRISFLDCCEGELVVHVARLGTNVAPGRFELNSQEITDRMSDLEIRRPMGEYIRIESD